MRKSMFTQSNYSYNEIPGHQFSLTYISIVVGKCKEGCINCEQGCINCEQGVSTV